MRGYALVQHIQQTSSDLLSVEEGSLYPALQRMLKAQRLKAEWKLGSSGRKVRQYSITLQEASEEQIRLDAMLKGVQLVFAL
jgi:DNA-binding PadR family transcriptional regulator